MLGKTTNQLLVKTEQAIEAKVPQQYQKAFQKAVHAGLIIMYSPAGVKIMQQLLAKQGDMISNIAAGAAKLLGELYRQSKGTLPMKVGIPAATVILCEGLDMLEKTGRIKVTEDVVAEATKDFGAFVMKLVGMTPEKLAALKVKAIQNRPGMIRSLQKEA